MAITIDKYTSVEVENYNGIYSIKQGWVGQDGVFKATIVKRRFKKDGEEKNAPLSVRLGDRDTALAVLREIASEIVGGDEVPF